MVMVIHEGELTYVTLLDTFWSRRPTNHYIIVSGKRTSYGVMKYRIMKKASKLWQYGFRL